VESFKDLRAFPRVDSQQSERQFTDLLKHIYSRHRNVVPVMAMGVAELKKELSDEVHAPANTALYRTQLYRHYASHLFLHHCLHTIHFACHSKFYPNRNLSPDVFARRRQTRCC